MNYQSMYFAPEVINPDLLREELYAAFPAWAQLPQMLMSRPVEFFALEAGIEMRVPEDADLVAVQAVIDAHDPEGLSLAERLEAVLAAANIGFKNLPTWATVTPEEGHDLVDNSVWGGQTEVEISAWIDTNVTNLAQAKTALKQAAGAIVTLRDMEARLAQGLLYLRDLTIK